MPGIALKNGLISYYGNPAGYTEKDAATVDNLFKKDDLESWLAAHSLRVTWTDGVMERLKTGEQMGGVENAAPLKNVRIWQLKSEVDVRMKFIAHDEMVKNFGAPNPADYRIAYDGQLGTNELRAIDDRCRVNMPPGYNGLPLGRACLGTLGKDLRVRAQFITTRFADHFDALKVAVLNRTGGPVDSLTLHFQDVLGKRAVPGNPNFADGIVPYVWINNGKAEWYAYQPTQADRKKLCQAVGLYLDAFRDRHLERNQDDPMLVYICAPLRGNLAENIEFARQKAQEVFQNGDLPICPHLLFPPIADATDTVQDEAARTMGLRLVESCQQINVYGTAWTAGMRAEIDHAQVLGIPVVAARKSIERTKPTARKQEKKSYER